MGTHRHYGNVKPLPLPVITEEWKDLLSKYFICTSKTGLRSVKLFSVVLMFYYDMDYSIDLQLSFCLSVCNIFVPACLYVFYLKYLSVYLPFVSTCQSVIIQSKLSVYLSVCLYYLSVFLSIYLQYLSVCMFFSLHYPYACLSVYIICLCIFLQYLSVWLSVICLANCLSE